MKKSVVEHEAWRSYTDVIMEGEFYNRRFKVHDMHGNIHEMILGENLTNKCYISSNFRYATISENYIKIINYDNEPHEDITYRDIRYDKYIHIFIPPGVSSKKISIQPDKTMQLDYNMVLSTLNVRTVSRKFDNYPVEQLTPLQEMMYRDILEIIKETFPEEKRNEDLRVLISTKHTGLYWQVYYNPDLCDKIDKYIYNVMLEASQSIMNSTYAKHKVPHAIDNKGKIHWF